MRPSPEEAARRLRGAATLLPALEVPTASAVGRVLADRYAARQSLPPGHRAAVDGYYLDPREAMSGRPLVVEGEVAAGMGPVRLPRGGGAVRVATGTALADPGAVVREEDVRREGDAIHLAGPVPLWDNIRRMGEEVVAGEALAGPGTVVTPWLAALLASVGHDRLRVRAQPTLLVIVTGDELRPLGALDAAGTVETHSLVVASWAAARGFGPVTTRQIGDEVVALAEALGEAADLILSTGGAGPGMRDAVQQAAVRVAARPIFEGVAMRPGGPTRAYRMGDRVWLALPGNPMAVALGLDLLAEAWWSGATGASPRPPGRAVAGQHLTGRAVVRFVRGRVAGGLFLPHPLQGAASLRTLAEAGVWAKVPPGGVAPGEPLEILPATV